MINTERQYLITLYWLNKFTNISKQLQETDLSKLNFDDQTKHQLQLDAVDSQIQSLQNEIDEYTRPIL